MLAVAGLGAGLSPLVAAPILGASILMVWVGQGRVLRARAGTAGEREAASWLRGFGTVVFGWRPPGARFDVDVVVVEPVLVAVEVKRAEGRVRIRRDGAVLVDGVPIPGEPLRQAVRGGASVRAALGLEELVPAVLCVTGMRQRPRRVEHSGMVVTVCSARHLRRVVRRVGPRVSRRDADELMAAFSLEQ